VVVALRVQVMVHGMSHEYKNMQYERGMYVKRLGAFPDTVFTGLWIGAHTTLRAPLSHDVRRPEALISRRALARLVYACGLGQLSRAEVAHDVFPTICRHAIGRMVSIRAGFIPESSNAVLMLNLGHTCSGGRGPRRSTCSTAVKIVFFLKNRLGGSCKHGICLPRRHPGMHEQADVMNVRK
jgi:hypothetical protein